MEAPKEVSATPTPDLKFVGGRLHQQFIVSYDDATSIAEYRPVPSEDGEQDAAVVTEQVTEQAGEQSNIQG